MHESLLFMLNEHALVLDPYASIVLQGTEAAQACIKNIFAVLDEALATRTFLVGERVTLADISCVCNLLMLYKQVS